MCFKKINYFIHIVFSLFITTNLLYFSYIIIVYIINVEQKKNSNKEKNSTQKCTVFMFNNIRCF